MTPLQFSLFFVALLLGYILVHLRLLKFETYLKEMAGIKTLNDRLNAVANAMDHIRVDRLEEQLQEIHEDLEGLRRVTERVERAQRDVEHQHAGPVIIRAPSRPPATASAPWSKAACSRWASATCAF